MLRKALTLGMVFILALSLLAVSMITCFTYDAEAHPDGHWRCVDPDGGVHDELDDPIELDGWTCCWYTHMH